MAQLVNVTISGPDEAWLAQHTRELVEKRMVACGNLVPMVRSIYRWDDKIEDEQESLVILHTQKSHISEIIAYTNDKHPYDTAQVVAIDVVGVDREYEKWVIAQTC